MTIKVKPLQEAINKAEAARQTFCLASPGTDEEFRAYLSGFDAALGIFRNAIEEGGDALGSDRASTDTSPGVTAGAVDPAAIWAEALREVLDDMWNLINAIDDEDFHGMVPGRPATIIGHYEEYHRRHIEHAQQIAESLTALIDKEQDHGR